MTESLMKHEKLRSYVMASQFADTFLPLVDDWSANYAVRDHFLRALESILGNLVKAEQRQWKPAGVYYLECSLGSVCECAACLDIAGIRKIVSGNDVLAGKQSLRSIANMEMKLRQSWLKSVAEEPGDYHRSNAQIKEEGYFDHEALEVYQAALSIFRQATQVVLESPKTPRRYMRRIDESGTSLILNIAEGNGRFSKLERQTFLSTAEDAATTLATYLDLSAARLRVDLEETLQQLRDVVGQLIGWGLYLND